jgi:serine/threonine-protein kinase
MIAGEKPWPEEEGRLVTVKVLDEPLRPIREVFPDAPRDLMRVIDRCLKKDPEQRYRSTYELRRELEMYVTRVVPIDPRGRIVLFLKNRKLITEQEAANFVQASLLSDAHLLRRDQGIPLPPARELLKPLGIAHIACVAVVLLAGVLAAFAPIGQKLPPDPPKVVIAGSEAKVDVKKDEKAAPVPAASGQKPLAGNEGFVKVIVEPWARVFVDGDFYDLTPFAEPIALSPGSHRIGFRNPYFTPLDQSIDVETGKTKIMKVSLLPKDEVDDAQNKK